MKAEDPCCQQWVWEGVVHDLPWNPALCPSLENSLETSLRSQEVIILPREYEDSAYYSSGPSPSQPPDITQGAGKGQAVRNQGHLLPSGERMEKCQR